MLIWLIVDIIIMFLQCLLLTKWNGLFLIIKRYGLFDLYLDDLGKVSVLTLLILALYILHQPLELGVDECLLQLVFVVGLGDELAGNLLVFFMHKIIN